MFVRDERKLLIFFQGHPEYDLHTLYREYRRDVRRFLTGERVTYPAMPRNYFTEDERALLTEFQSRATAVREDALMDNFPLAGSQFLPGDAWQKPAIAVMGAWLGQFAKSKRAQRPTRVREPGIEAISQGGA
jgi:homoserine O-succinyltransferase